MSGQMIPYGYSDNQVARQSQSDGNVTVAGDHAHFAIKNNHKRVAFAFQGRDSSPLAAAAIALAKTIAENR